ncbi:MAG TPA: hypothetical protein VJV05_13765, partial [Pyrinomonadaceae bacterium]|nr:hypothetical protein [Pyrinomonadaceae bacterium]
MEIKSPLRRFVVSLFLTALAVVAAFAQAEPDPNSPVPVLLSGSDASRVRTTEPIAKLAPPTKTEPQTFEPNSRIVLYVTNVELLKSEGASAFRVYVVDASGRLYRFPVVGLEPALKQKGVYALRVELRDELGFTMTPPTRGDVLVSVAWRGLASNWLRLGLGGTGGIEDVSKLIARFGDVEETNAVGYFDSGDRIRFLEQASFGPSKALDLRVRRLGLRTWLADQFETAYP